MIFLSLGFFIKAQVFNNAYNNFENIYYRTSTDEYIYNYDVFFDFITINRSTYCVGVSTIPETYFDTTKLSYTYFVKLDKNGDTIKTKKILFYQNELTSLGDPIQLSDDRIMFAGYTKEKRLDLDRISTIVIIDTNLNVIYSDTLFSSHNTNITKSGVYSDSSFVLLVAFDSDSTPFGINLDYNLVEIDSNYNILQNTIWGGPEFDALSDFLVLPNGHLLLSALTDSYGQFNEDIHLMEIDIEGNIIWDQTFGYPGRDITPRNSILRVNSTGHILVSGWTELSTGSSGAWLIKTDSIGNLLWDTIYDRGPFFDGFVGIRSSPDNNIILSGSTHDYTDASSPPFGWLLKLDLEGDIIWERFPSKYNNQYNSDDYINTHKIDQNGNILLCGYVTGAYKEDTVYHANDAWLWKSDSCGFTSNNPTQALLVIDSIIDYTVYLSNQSEEYCTGSYLISGTNGLLDSTEIYAYSAWTNGDSVNQFQYTFSDTGSYEFSLFVTGGDSTDVYTIQFSILDTATNITNLGLELNIVSVFPNPAKDYIVIQATLDDVNEDPQSLLCEVYATTGRLIKTYSLNPKLYQQRIFVDELSNGVYLLNFTVDGKGIGNKRLSVVR
ncbi:MAG: hypothetical protein ACI9O4_001230 [Chitinophagales bacterium]